MVLRGPALISAAVRDIGLGDYVVSVDVPAHNPGHYTATIHVRYYDFHWKLGCTATAASSKTFSLTCGVLPDARIKFPLLEVECGIRYMVLYASSINT